MELSKVAALVTGGTSGLGRAAAEALARRGARVAVVGRDEGRGRDLARSLGEPHLFLRADVTSPDQVEAASRRAAEAFGGLSVLVNCAGIGIIARVLDRRGPSRLEDFAHVVNVNLVGTFNCVRLLAPILAACPPDEDGERGVIVNTSSIAAFEGQVGQAAYAASKGGIASMTLPLARELAEHGIRVVAIAPGLFDTPMLGPLPLPVRQSLEAQTVFPSRFGRPEEYAALVLHVIRNPALNGAVLRLDGAMRMGMR
jgi:3-hydroxyacyl-CoA dehydrogenase / 3-hydroxy-2-methylbutyryl-CoA dehydrogenase